MRAELHGPSTELRLGFSEISWPELHTDAGLERLHHHFLAWLDARDPGLADRVGRAPSSDRDAGARLLALAPHVGAYLAQLFGIEEEVEALRQAILGYQPEFDFHKRFVKGRLKKRPPPESDAAEAAAVAGRALEAMAGKPVDLENEREVAQAVLALLDLYAALRKRQRQGGATFSESMHAGLERLQQALRRRDADPAASDEAWLQGIVESTERAFAARMADPADPASSWRSVRTKGRQSFAELVPLRIRVADDGLHESVGAGPLRTRAEPFALTDSRGSSGEAAHEVSTCLDCHERGKDSCRTGLRDRKGKVKDNPLGVALAGCPLGERVGEMQQLRRAGDVLGALSVVVKDNPMMPGTGHRICNDCMKACVYQTHEPVDIPKVESRVLDDVLGLPFGFEIWSLLTRWNPLRVDRPFPRPFHGKRVLVVGLGPAGYTLAHHLLNEGFGVVAVDALKVEALPEEWLAPISAPPPIRDASVLREALDLRVVLGFGGVSEYGITARWDKSYLLMIYLNLRRRRHFAAFGGVRFGGAVDVESAFALGFDHVALAVGAGKPKMVPLDGNLARGIRKASDFLMGLQLSGAYQRRSLANLQLRLPVVVIGSGLTAIDAATEALAYYVVQCERTVERYERLAESLGEDELRGQFDEEELEVIDEAHAHGRALLAERAAAAEASREPRFQPLLDAWGGVRIVYRRRFEESPAYRLNHEEVHKSLEEGVRYVELLSPVAAKVDSRGALCGLTFERQASVDGRLEGQGEYVELKAKTALVAAGTRANVVYEREHPGTFRLDDRGYFENFRAGRDERGGVRLVPGEGAGFFTSYESAGRTVSYYGDAHPRYSGSVVKAMASAKDGYPAVVELFDDLDTPGDEQAFRRFVAELDDAFGAVVQNVTRLAPGIVEVIVRAPAAARAFRPGQFYRFQNYERNAETVDGTRLAMEGLALTGAAADPERGWLSLIALEMGASSRLCARLKVGERVVVMGPTGAPTTIPREETVLLIGGGLGNAVLFSIASALKAAGCRVLYFAGYRRGELLFRQADIEAHTDQVVWATDAGEPIAPRRPSDAHFRGNMVDALIAFADGRLGPRSIELSDVTRIIAIGSDGLMRAVRDARHGSLAPYLSKTHQAIGSINSPMQCMMKEVCGQCIQRHVDPKSGREYFVYSCFDQDQPLDHVDFVHLKQRLRQNSAQEKLSSLWASRLFAMARSVEGSA